MNEHPRRAQLKSRKELSPRGHNYAEPITGKSLENSQIPDPLGVVRCSALHTNASSVNNAFCRTGPDLAWASVASKGAKVMPQRG
jgi:hypothetical protein